MPTVGEVLADSPADRLDTECLLTAALACSRAALIAHPEWRLDTTVYTRLQAELRRRADGEPLAYITGTREFWSLCLRVTPDVLIPRPETECLVERALELIPNGPCRILDLGTGSGAIALALAHERPDASVTATDQSAAALKIARDNAITHGIGNVEFLQRDWFDGLRDAPFDLIISNPPYVADTELASAQQELAHEPIRALRAERNGMAALEQIVHGAPEHLEAGGWLLVEHGADQADAMATIFEESGFRAIRLHRDLAALPRVTEGNFIASA